MEPINKILRTPSALVILIVAIFTLIGVIIKSKTDENIARIPINATSTAEARLTEFARISTATQIAIINLTPSPTFTNIPPTETFTPIPTNTPIPDFPANCIGSIGIYKSPETRDGMIAVVSESQLFYLCRKNTTYNSFLISLESGGCGKSSFGWVSASYVIFRFPGDFPSELTMP